MKTLDIVNHTLCLIPSVTGFFETKSKQSFSSFSRLIFLNDKLNIQQCCYKFVPKLERDNILFWMVISNFFSRSNSFAIKVKSSFAVIKSKSKLKKFSWQNTIIITSLESTFCSVTWLKLLSISFWYLSQSS